MGLLLYVIYMARDRYEDVISVETEKLTENQKTILVILWEQGYTAKYNSAVLYKLQEHIPDVIETSDGWKQEMAKSRKYTPALQGLWKRGLVEKLTTVINAPGVHCWWLTAEGADLAKSIAQAKI